MEENTEQVLREIRDILKALFEQNTRAITESEARRADAARQREDALARAKEAMPRIKEKAEAAQLRMNESFERQRALTDLAFKQARLRPWALGILAGAVVVLLLIFLSHHQ